MRRNIKVRALAVAILACAAGFTARARAEDLESRHQFSIPAQSLDTALLAFSDQAKVQVLMWADGRSNARSAGATGDLVALDALKAILKDTGLSFKQIDRETIAIVVAGSPTSKASGNPGSDPRESPAVRLAQNDAASRDANTQSESAASAPSRDEEKNMLAEIVVTGTRLSNVSPSSPLITLKREDLDRGGFTTVAEAVGSTSQNYASTTSSTSFVSNSNAGLTDQIDLRGLGPEATLVLVNGRRISTGAGDQGRAVDVSSIPISAIDRIDILTDGASALYGSDAIGGVVNVVLRKTFNGSETTLQSGSNTTGADRILASETFGNNWGSGQFLVTAQYDEKQALRTRELGITTVDFRARGGGDFRQPGFGSPGTVLPLGVFAGQPFTTLTGPNGEPVFSTSLPPGDGRNLQLDQLGLNQVNYTDAVATDIAPHEHNTSIYGTVEQDLGAVTLFADAAYSDRVSRLRTVNAFTYIYVPQSNAFSPFHEDVLVGYEFADFGPIAYVVDNTGWFADLGVRGVFGPKEWTWELVASRSENRSDRSYDLPDLVAINARLASSDPSFAFNPFGDGSGQSPGVVDALRQRNALVGTTGYSSIAFQTSGDLFALAAGPVKLAAGGEYHLEDLSARSLVEGQPEQDLFVGSSRNVSAIFGEAYVPLAAHSSFGDLALSLAARYEHYSDFGNTFNPKIGVIWRPSDALQLKANYGSSFRAPSLRELDLFTTTYPQTPVFDPNAPGGGAVAYPNLVVGGNKNLDEETADTYTISADYRPEWLAGSRFAATYFHTDYDNRIRGVLDGLSVGQLFELEGELPPGILVRDAAGNLTQITLTNINSAKTLISGYDVSAGYVRPTAWGDLGASVSATIFAENSDQLIAGTPAFDLKGAVGNPAKWRGRLELTWSNKPWSAFVAVNATDGLHNDDPDPRIVQRSVDGQTTVDAQLCYTGASGNAWTQGLTVRLGATNLFDRRPPFVDGSAAWGVDPRNFVIEGRTVYLRITKQVGGP